MNHIAHFAKSAETYPLHLSQLITSYFYDGFSHAQLYKESDASDPVMDARLQKEVEGDPLLQGDTMDLMLRRTQMIEKDPDAVHSPDVAKLNKRIERLAQESLDRAKIDVDLENDIFDFVPKKKFTYKGENYFFPENLEKTQERVYQAFLGIAGVKAFNTKIKELHFKAVEAADRTRRLKLKTPDDAMFEADEEEKAFLEARKMFARRAIKERFPEIKRLRYPKFIWDDEKLLPEGVVSWLENRTAKLAKNKFGGQEWFEIEPYPDMWNKIVENAAHRYDTLRRVTEWVRKEPDYIPITLDWSKKPPEPKDP
jgi:hypothetical protein